MDLIYSMQSAIAFMEDHLLEPITYEDVAKYLYVSSYHFHRTFRLFTGMPAAEYIKNRRLSLAGQELLTTTHKVIDIALKYCYESPESFAKAFLRFHGVTPSRARKPGAKLKLFHRFQIKITLQGGTSMDYRIEERKPFRLIAKVKEFRNEIIAEDGNVDIPNFWDACLQDGTFNLLNTCSGTEATYGLCSPVSKESDTFLYGIGKEYSGSNCPEGLIVWEVTHPLWAVFKCIGTNGNCLSDMWNRIFTEFLPGSAYNMPDETDFELYSDTLGADCFCELWIPIEKKQL